MAIRLYNPRTKAFVLYTTPDVDLSTTDMLLTNILIELKVLAHYLQLISQPTDETTAIRDDVVGF